MDEFNYDRFLSLTGQELYDYMEPILAKRLLDADKIKVEQIIHDLPDFDEYHLVYALLIGSELWPNVFIPMVPRYLIHKAGSVYGTAVNILSNVPGKYITEELVNAICRVPRSYAERSFLQEVIDLVEKRL